MISKIPLAMFAVIATVLITTTTTTTTVYAWELTVNLSGSDFGDDRVCASLEGGYGYGPTSQCTQAGSNADVTFNVGDRIEQGENYEVCGYSGVMEAIFGECRTFTHGSGDESVSISS